MMKSPNVEMEKNPNYLPEELLIEILSRLPAKSVRRFRCVSKSWGEYLSTSQFVKLHHTRGSTSHLILSNSKLHTFNLDGDDTVVSRKLDIPGEFDYIAGYCNGFVLLLLRGGDEFLVVNPATLEQVTIKNRPSPPRSYNISCGFGYDSRSDDYKIVKLNLVYTNRDLSNGYQSEAGTTVDVYSLRKGAWNSLNINPRLFAPSYDSGVFVNGDIYWFVHHWPSDFPNFIAAFDVASESFRYTRIPDVACHSRIIVNGACQLMVCYGDIWMMKENFWTKFLEHGEENSWTKFPKSVTVDDWREVTPLFLVGGNEVVLARDRSLSLWDVINGTTKDLIVDGALDRVVDGVTYVESLDSPIQYCFRD